MRKEGIKEKEVDFNGKATGKLSEEWKVRRKEGKGREVYFSRGRGMGRVGREGIW